MRTAAGLHATGLPTHATGLPTNTVWAIVSWFSETNQLCKGELSVK